MLKRSFVFASSALVFALFLLWGGPLESRAETVKLTYSNFFPPSHAQSKLAMEWCRRVEKETEGRVRIDYFPGQTLTKGKVCYDGVVNGLSDVGMSVLGYTRGRFPIMEVGDLPLGQGGGRVATATVNEVYQKMRPREFSDTQVMYLHAHGPGLLHTRKKAVRRLEDLKGMKIRCHGSNLKIARALGATPVAKPMPMTYPLLQKGVVDGSMYPLEANKGWKLAEVIDYATLCYSAAYTTTFFVVMNKDKWAMISPADQEKIQKVNEEWIEKTGEAWEAADQEGLRFLKEKKVELVRLDETESARWAEAAAPVIDEYVANARKKGLDGEKALGFALEAVKKYRKRYGVK
ncbi:C4-dicarboxylate ABC transporter substrate-binding protein [Candidatus Desulfarcum epimagneticum]|uniref:C4-dicarboxylate ABC transporter substrate-binding protein n=1 Tax=uncultured Desulfobacteraceae bacterium TaxID=218296 RepID=A0A484HCJ3_9BACT|nr:C4-dicarboxylate ABC transporter substrate-binding protein [uncultured Desulfobacteraceae bacterium]